MQEWGEDVRLENHIEGRWQRAEGDASVLVNPVTGESLAEVCSAGVDFEAALRHGREVAGAKLRASGYATRAGMLAEIAEVLVANREAYFDISRQNSGATEADAGFDVDGAIFTLKSYARSGRTLGDAQRLHDGPRVPLSRSGVFEAQHFIAPMEGVAIFINAFNFPAWGLWEKAAPALLAGMPVFVKPATPTAWLAQRMVADVVDAGILPEGALSIVCGAARDLLDHVGPNDVVSFTGSADTARRMRSHPAVIAHSVRVNVEADSVNSAIVGPDAVPGSEIFELAVKEVVREMTVKTGQKCTAIRRVMVPGGVAREFADAVAERLARMTVGDPAVDGVRVGPLVSRAQQAVAYEGISRLREDCELVFGGGENFSPLGADADASAFVQPTLLFCQTPHEARHVHDVEVFGPVATVMPYEDAVDVIALARRGGGSLVASAYSGDPSFVTALVEGIAPLHGRVMVVDALVGNQHTGHGNVMPSCLHGGPGRAGGGEELGGLRALALYHRRYVVQGAPAMLDALMRESADAALLAG